jgi:sugar transferase (PEP-CTERM/EpsH1 system associated)
MRLSPDDRSRPDRISFQAVDSAPLVAHLVYRFDTGGLENGVVNLINHMPRSAYRHAVIALTEVVPAFAQRIHREDVAFYSLRKPPGHGLVLYPRLARLMRELNPAIVHTRNLAALECQVPAWWSGVPARIHGEHGWDIGDPDGTVRRFQWIRRAYRPLVDHYIALSHDLADYLRQRIGVPAQRLTQIINGVDTERFRPAEGGRAGLAGSPFTAPGLFVIGTVGRMQTVKAQPLLSSAFVRALEMAPALRQRLRLVLVGDGPLRAEAQAILAHGGVSTLAWMPGERADVPDILRALDAFVLPSLAEGISNTILEAMASALPVLACRVGGNAELVVDGQTGTLVPAGDVEALARELVALASDPSRAAAMGSAGRLRVEQHFSLPAMVAAYQGVYDHALARARSQPNNRLATDPISKRH